MFDNIGGKIKTLTKVIFAIMVTCSIILNVIGGVVLGKAFRGIIPGILLFLLVIISIGLGVLFSWIFCFFMYGFGELIESQTSTAENTGFMLTKLDSGASGSASVRPSSSAAFRKDGAKENGAWQCKYCGYENPDIISFCRNCQKSRY